jgi:hypothetical protein
VEIVLFKDKIFIEIGSNFATEYCVRNPIKFNIMRLNLKSKISTRKYTSLDSLRIESLDPKAQLYFIYSGDGFFIKLIELPHVREKVIDEMIINEMGHLFEKVDDLAYSYEILKDRKNTSDLLIYCINNETNKLLLGYCLEIKGIFLIQLCILDFMQQRIKSESSISVISYNSDLYMISCLGRKIVGSTLIKDYNGSNLDFYNNFQYVLEGYRKMETYLEIKKDLQICFANFNIKDIIEELAGTYSCVDIGTINMEDVISSILLKEKLHV